MSQSQIDEIFERHPFDEEDFKLHQAIYDNLTSFSRFLDPNLPDCPEKTLGYRKLREALMYFGCAIGKKDKYKANHSN